MNNGLTPRLPGPLGGKLLLIILIVFTSSLSFVLGYLVGVRSSGFRDREIIRIKPAENQSVPTPETTAGDTASGITSDMDAVTKINPTPDQPAKKEAAKAVENVPVQTPAIKHAGPVSKPAERKTPEHGGIFSIQTGAFTREKEARILKSNLSKKGYNTYIQKVRSAGRKVFKVRVGNFKTRAEAESVVAELKKMKGMKPFIVVSNRRQ